jgi:hypothetical protein
LVEVSMSDDTKVIEFIPRDQWEKQFAVEASKPDGKPLRKEMNRKRVVSAFMDAFELLGGTEALVDWAGRSNENQTNFYKLYARLLPSQANEIGDEAKRTYIGHVAPRTVLDE